MPRYIESELVASKLICAKRAEGAHMSSLRLVPKAHQLGKFRLIIDLSAPQGASVNDGVPTEFCSVSYASMNNPVC